MICFRSLALAALASFAFSCGDVGKPTAPDPDLVGSWELRGKQKQFRCFAR